MNNWDKYKRMQCNIQKGIFNQDVITQMGQHYQQLHSLLVKNPMDEDVFNDSYIKLTYQYNPDKDFVDQFRWIFQQLKGAYYRDDMCNHFYQITEDRLSIPDIIPDKAPDVDTSVVDKLKALYSPIV